MILTGKGRFFDTPDTRPFEKSGDKASTLLAKYAGRST